MRVLIACEESQAITIEFRNLGIEAYSCDLLPCSGGHPEWHFQEDVFNVIGRMKWDLMIAHPPCTYLTVTANRWLKEQPKLKSGALVGAERIKAREEAMEFFIKLYECDIPRICIENPVGVMGSKWRKADQIIHPKYFGDPFEKLTCLWLKNLPKLWHAKSIDLFTNEITHTKPEPRYEWIDSKTGKIKSQPSWFAKASQKNGERGKIRSKTFPGIAKAMAVQWGEYILEQNKVYDTPTP